jgi:hypothetical protein
VRLGATQRCVLAALAQANDLTLAELGGLTALTFDQVRKAVQRLHRADLVMLTDARGQFVRVHLRKPT